MARAEDVTEGAVPLDGQVEGVVALSGVLRLGAAVQQNGAAARRADVAPQQVVAVDAHRAVAAGAAVGRGGTRALVRFSERSAGGSPGVLTAVEQLTRAS